MGCSNRGKQFRTSNLPICSALLTSSFGRAARVVILSGASRRIFLSRRSSFSISGSGCGVEESLFGVTKTRDVNRAKLLSNPKQEDLVINQSCVRILVVDDFAAWRRYVVENLGRNSSLLVIAVASDGLEAVLKAEELRPDLILLDIGLPKLSGIEAARRIRKLAPDSKIIFLTQESSDDVVQTALSLGASGFVVKQDAGRDLLAAVEAIISGRTFVSGT
jgi:CheY-like chemotaxis protein